VFDLFLKKWMIFDFFDLFFKTHLVSRERGIECFDLFLDWSHRAFLKVFRVFDFISELGLRTYFWVIFE
jgi:hypothetical protein